MNKRIFLRIATAIISVIILSLGLFGCATGLAGDYENDFFVFKRLRSDDFGVTKLTDKGKKQAELYIPSVHKFVNIASIGLSENNPQYDEKDIIKSDTLETLVIPDTVSRIKSPFDTPKLKRIILFPHSEILQKPSLVDFSDPEFVADMTAVNGKILLRKSAYEILYPSISDSVKPIVKLATVEYMYNNTTTTNGGYYFLDSVSSGEKLVAPKIAPTWSKTFRGWYVDEACVTKWDFAKDTVTLTKTEPTLRLYAKWE